MRRNKDKGREAVELLASSFVISIGMFACIVFVFAFSRNPTRPLVICAGLFVGLHALAFLLRDRNDRGGLKLWFESRKPSQSIDYIPKARRRKKGSPTTDTRPATLESLRKESETSGSTWVPSSVRGTNREPKS
jgi:hypothetical protein